MDWEIRQPTTRKGAFLDHVLFNKWALPLRRGMEVYEVGGIAPHWALHVDLDLSSPEPHERLAAPEKLPPLHWAQLDAETSCGADSRTKPWEAWSTAVEAWRL